MRADLSVLFACTLLGLLQPVAAQAQTPAEVTQLELTRRGATLELAAAIQFDLPAAVHDALFKGLPVIFVEEVEIFRERWYWFDKRVGGAQRHMRLVFQPLIRRWRLTVSSGPSANAAAGQVALSQTFDTVEEAIGVIRRVAGWPVADVADLEKGVGYRVDFRFRLDLTQLPRPLQIGALGESDWALSAAATRYLPPESVK